MKTMEDPARQKVTPRGPDQQASICDELGVRKCCPTGDYDFVVAFICI